MTGNPWFDAGPAPDRIAHAVALDREAAFVDDVTGIAARGFIALQVIVYAGAVVALRRRSASGSPRRLLEMGALAVVAFPGATYLVGIVDGHTLGTGPFVTLLVGIDVALVAAVWALLRRPQDRLVALTGATALLLVADLVTGARLQINTILGYSPIVGGRFAGIGNMAFAVLGATALATAALLIQSRRGRGPAWVVALVLLATVVVVDGAPMWGSDIGGILALVPAYGVALLLFLGVRPSLRAAVGLALAAVAVVALFLVFDLSRPPESRTHLARLYENIAESGAGVLTETLERKAAANLRLLTRSVWALSVPPAALCLAFLLLWPRGTWGRLSARMPAASAGLVAALVLAGVGFAVNDSGIAIPSMVLAFFVPYALFARLALTDELGDEPAPEPAG